MKGENKSLEKMHRERRQRSCAKDKSLKTARKTICTGLQQPILTSSKKRPSCWRRFPKMQKRATMNSSFSALVGSSMSFLIPYLVPSLVDPLLSREVLSCDLNLPELITPPHSPPYFEDKRSHSVWVTFYQLAEPLLIHRKKSPYLCHLSPAFVLRPLLCKLTPNHTSMDVQVTLVFIIY